MVGEVIGNFSSGILGGYQSFLGLLPLWTQSFINFFILVLLIVIYVIFVWKLYRFIATKNIFHLNLRKYSRAQHPVLDKTFASALYFLEYIIILPVLIFVWFAVFTIFLILLTRTLEVGTVLMVAATVIAAIRMTSYYNQDISKEVAKMLPFMLLAVSLLDPGFFNAERIFSQFSMIPSYFGNIAYYLIFILVIEIILRAFDLIFSIFGIGTEEKQEKTRA